MRVLMLSWELPPSFAGGVGMVCAEICKELSNYDDIEIQYAMPYGPKNTSKFSSNCNVQGVQFEEINFSNIYITKIPTLLGCYQTPHEYEVTYEEFLNSSVGEFKTSKEIYGENILQEVELYARRIVKKFQNQHFDVIHAHDWTTIRAAIELKKKTGIPIIFHVHITEFDKTGNQGGHPEIMKIEKEGFEQADIIVAVSNYVKHQLISKYNVNPQKIRVVYNAKISDLVKSKSKNQLFENKKTVLFMGRMTLQKGPEYFLRAAKKVLEYRDDVIFVIAGGGDMLQRVIELSYELGINNNVYFHGGAYTRVEAERYYSSSDVFVMPSVSEPFGVVPYEAIVKGTPTIISKQSGISEVLKHAFKVDFWDTDEIAHKILALLEYEPLHNYLSNNAFEEVDSHTWDKSVREIVSLYSLIKHK